MSRFATAVAADFARLAAVHRHVAILTTSVALNLGAVFLDVPKFAARVAFLLFLPVAIPSQMTRSAADVTALLPLSFRLGTVFSDVASFPAAVARVLEITVLGIMTSFTTAITDVRLAGGAALRTSATTSWCSPSSSSFRTLPGPVARASTLEATFTAHGYGEIFQ